MKATFTTMLQVEGKSATGLQVPAEVVAALGKQKRPSIRVPIAGNTYLSTIALFGDVFMLPLSAEQCARSAIRWWSHSSWTRSRARSGCRTTWPQPGAAAAFDALVYSMRCT